MYRGSKVAVIIAAAGRGTRFGTDVPKQFLDTGGVPVIVKTVRAFISQGMTDDIIIVTDSAYADHCRGLMDRYFAGDDILIVEGGAERQDSVANALAAVRDGYPGTEYILVHDAARPFVSGRVITDVIAETARSGACTACVPMKDSIRIRCEDGTTAAEDRNRFAAVQTPQGFRKDIIFEAYRKAYSEGFYGTDDAVLAERAGHPAAAVEGDHANIKITTREDLPMEYRTGTGFDVHAFAEGRDLILGGVSIPYEKGLAGHSDADVLTHALMDALLGAAALGDIGKLFPDTDEQYRGISSILLLEKVAEALEERSYSLVNADITVIAQAPKISPYTEEMRELIAETLKTGKDKINIKGTTTEHLGFTGRKEGIAALAVCSISR